MAADGMDLTAGMAQMVRDHGAGALVSARRSESDFRSLLTRTTEAGLISVLAGDASTAEHPAGQLVRRRYADSGYDLSAAQMAHRGVVCTVQALLDRQIAGTVGVRPDSMEGLTADLAFGHVLDALRDEGYSLCEVTRLAVERDAPARAVLASLFHVVYLLAKDRFQADRLVIEVNPRHVSFYKRMLGFVEHGEVWRHPVVDAPATLLSLDLSFVQGQIMLYGGQPELVRLSRNLYPMCLPMAEEAEVMRAIWSWD